MKSEKNYIHIHIFFYFPTCFSSVALYFNNAEDFRCVLQMTAELFVFTRCKILPLYYLMLFQKHRKDNQVAFLFLLSSKGRQRWLQKKKLLSFSLYERAIPS